MFFVSLENIVYIAYLCIEYLFCKHPKDEHCIPSCIVYILVLLYDHSVNTNLLLVISDFMCNSIYGNRLFSNLISTNAN